MHLTLPALVDFRLQERNLFPLLHHTVPGPAPLSDDEGVNNTLDGCPEADTVRRKCLRTEQGLCDVGERERDLRRADIGQLEERKKDQKKDLNEEEQNEHWKPSVVS